MDRIDSLLSARLFISPQVVGDRIYFLSNLSGHLSLYRMNYGGSVPEPLIPPRIALQNPHLLGGLPFYVFPHIQKILIMLDHDGDENYQPHLIPLEGGYPEPVFSDILGQMRSHLVFCDIHNNIAYFNAESHDDQNQHAFRANLRNQTLSHLGASPYGAYPGAYSPDHRRAILVDGYTTGDMVLYEWKEETQEKSLRFGIPLEKRAPGETIPLNGINAIEYLENNELLVSCALFTDRFAPAVLLPGDLQPLEVAVDGIKHTGDGELETLSHLSGNRYLLVYNIDGCSWLYEASFDRSSLRLTIDRVLVGDQPPLTNGMVFSYSYDPLGDRYALSFSTATSPTQIYTIEGDRRDKIFRHTHERILGIPQENLSPGEDASFISFDGTRISARLYLPAPSLGFSGKRPLVYYIHGGPQGQERPDFAWFSMPLIQFLTLNGFAVFVPNVRGSTGYGLGFTKQVDRDWGGKDRLDHVHAMQILKKDPRIDASRAGVVGRSYGGYMTLTLAGRHPDLWSAAVDMFGPFDLLTFLERIPETWKPYMKMALGDPETDLEFLVDRSPKTHLHQLSCPLLVIQGKNDPRVVEPESRDLIAYLRSLGKDVEYLMFENEGHDVLKFENRVRCYETITEFFKKHLNP